MAPALTSALTAACIARAGVWHALDQAATTTHLLWLHGCIASGKTWALRGWSEHRRVPLNGLKPGEPPTIKNEEDRKATSEPTLFAMGSPLSVWVLDDAHLIADDDAAWLRRCTALREQLPDNALLVVISQMACPQSLREHAVVSGPAQLEVTPAEAVNLALCWHISAELAERLRHLSQGWIGVMRLAARDWQAGLHAEESVIDDDTVAAAVNTVAYAMLQHSLLEALPPAALEALALCSFLPRFTASQAGAVTHHPDMPRILQNLLHQGIVTLNTAESPPIYVFHRLLHSYLQDVVLPRMPQKKINESVQRAVVLLEDSDNVLAAARLLSRRGGSDAMVSFAKRHAIALADQAEPELISALTAELNPKRMKIEGRLCLLGGLGRLPTQPAEALSWIDLAWMLASARQDHACLRRAAEAALRNLHPDNEPELLSVWMQRGAQMLSLGPEPDRRTWLSLWSAYAEVLGQRMIDDPLFIRYLEELIDACHSIDIPGDLRLCLVAQLAVHGTDVLPPALLQRFLRQTRPHEQPALREWVPMISLGKGALPATARIPAYALQFALQVSESMIVLGEHEEASVWLELCQREGLGRSAQFSHAMALSAVMSFQRGEEALAARKAEEAYKLARSTCEDESLSAELGIYAAACALFSGAEEEALCLLDNLPSVWSVRPQRRANVELLHALATSRHETPGDAAAALGACFKSRARQSLPILWQLFSQPLLRACCRLMSEGAPHAWSGLDTADLLRHTFTPLTQRLAELDVISLRRAQRLFAHQSVQLRLMGAPVVSCGAWSAPLNLSAPALMTLIALAWAPGGLLTRQTLKSALSEVLIESIERKPEVWVEEINRALQCDPAVTVDARSLVQIDGLNLWLREPHIFIDMRGVTAALPLARASVSEVNAGELADMLAFALSFTSASLVESCAEPWLGLQRQRLSQHCLRMYRRLGTLRTVRE